MIEGCPAKNITVQYIISARVVCIYSLCMHSLCVCMWRPLRKKAPSIQNIYVCVFLSWTCLYMYSPAHLSCTCMHASFTHTHTHAHTHKHTHTHTHAHTHTHIHTCTHAHTGLHALVCVLPFRACLKHDVVSANVTG